MMPSIALKYKVLTTNDVKCIIFWHTLSASIRKWLVSLR